MPTVVRSASLLFVFLLNCSIFLEMYGVHEKSIKQLNRDLLFIEVQDIRRESVANRIYCP